MRSKKARFTAHVVLTLEVPALSQTVAGDGHASTVKQSLDEYLDELRGAGLLLFRAPMHDDSVGVRLVGSDVTRISLGNPGDEDEEEDEPVAAPVKAPSGLYVPVHAPYDQHVARIAMLEYVKDLALDLGRDGEPLDEAEAHRVAAKAIRLGQIYAHHASRRPRDLSTLRGAHRGQA